MYDRKRAACIDPHIDDVWLWGDRLFTINMLENTFLTLTPSTNTDNQVEKNIEILIPMARFSLLILQNDARYKWLHSINACHIKSLRMAMTFRELSDHFLNEQSLESLVKIIENLALSYKGIFLNFNYIFNILKTR